MLKKYNDMVNEKKDIKAEKSAIVEKIYKLFKEKPEIKGSSKWPDSQSVYNMASIKNYIGNEKVDQVFGDMRKDKNIKYIRVKNLSYDEYYPYYYHEHFTTKEEAEKCKEEMEKNQTKKLKVTIKRQK